MGIPAFYALFFFEPALAGHKGTRIMGLLTPRGMRTVGVK